MSNTQIAIRDLAPRYQFNRPLVIPFTSRDGRPIKPPYVPQIDRRGYPVISYRNRKLGITMKVQIHQIVAYQKYGNAIFEQGIMCRHLDNDKTNFAPENIVLGTALENHLDNTQETRDKLFNAAKIAAKNRRKMTIEQAEEIRRRVRAGELALSLAIEFKVSKSTISYLVNYHTYRSA